MQANIIQERRDFLRDLLRIVIKIRVIIIEVFLISINLVHNNNFLSKFPNNFDLRVRVLIINISDLINMSNQLSHFLANIIVKMLI